MITPERLPTDRLLPHLAAVLDCAAMQMILQEALCGEGGSFCVTACQIEWMKYKPGLSCLVCYRLCLLDKRSGKEIEQILCGRLYPVGESHSRFRKAQQEPLSATRLGTPLLHLANLEMVIWLFPNDRKLTSLPRLIDPEYLRQVLLPAVIQAHFGEQWQIHTLQQAVVHYVPEHTCTVRIALCLQEGQSSKRQEITLFGKTYYNNDGAETDRLMRELWESTARQKGQLALAEPLGYDTTERILWQRGLAGHPLLAYALGSESFCTHLAAAARTLAVLHRQASTCRQEHKQTAWLDKLQTMRQWLPQVQPAIDEPLKRVVDHLMTQASQLAEEPVALLHGDLHLQNFFVEAAQVALIDMDNLALGSPWQDIGSFLAGLHYGGLMAGHRATEINTLATIFCKAYGAQSAWPVSPRAIDWYTAAALINERAFRMVSRLKGHGLALLEPLLARAASISGL